MVFAFGVTNSEQRSKSLWEVEHYRQRGEVKRPNSDPKVFPNKGVKFISKTNNDVKPPQHLCGYVFGISTDLFSFIVHKFDVL